MTLTLLLLAGAVPARAAHSVDAHEVVNAVAAANAANAGRRTEAKAEEGSRGDAGGGGGSSKGSIDGALQDLLPSRLELTAGTDGLVVLSDVSKQVSLFAEARYRLTRGLQLGGSLAFRYQSSDTTSDTAFQMLVGPTFNFGPGQSLSDSYFVSTLAGVTTGSTSFGSVVVGSNTQLTLGLHGGKRFALSESVSYAPAIGVVKELDYKPSFVFQPISLSVFF